MIDFFSIDIYSDLLFESMNISVLALHRQGPILAVKTVGNTVKRILHEDQQIKRSPPQPEFHAHMQAGPRTRRHDLQPDTCVMPTRVRPSAYEGSNVHSTFSSSNNVSRLFGHNNARQIYQQHELDLPPFHPRTTARNRFMRGPALDPIPPNARRASSAEERTSKPLLQDQYDAGHTPSQLPASSWGGGPSQIVFGDVPASSKRNLAIRVNIPSRHMVQLSSTSSGTPRSSPRGRSWGGGPSTIVIGQPSTSQKRHSSSTRATRAVLGARSMARHTNQQTQQRVRKPTHPNFETEQGTNVATHDVGAPPESVRVQQHSISPRGRSWGGGPSTIVIGQPSTSQQRRSSSRRATRAVPKAQHLRNIRRRPQSQNESFEMEQLGDGTNNGDGVVIVPPELTATQSVKFSGRGKSFGGGKSQIVIGDPHSRTLIRPTHQPPGLQYARPTHQQTPDQVRSYIDTVACTGSHSIFMCFCPVLVAFVVCREG